mmetsp:Transcript_124863/g.399160  ORF Transcript_124863/g.399160 Transcript_124863/m.399160 type:complete len:210 (-) Transcript_124863:1985-2614(-)
MRHPTDDACATAGGYRLGVDASNLRVACAGIGSHIVVVRHPQLQQRASSECYICCCHAQYHQVRLEEPSEHRMGFGETHDDSRQSSIGVYGREFNCQNDDSQAARDCKHGVGLRKVADLARTALGFTGGRSHKYDIAVQGSRVCEHGVGFRDIVLPAPSSAGVAICKFARAVPTTKSGEYSVVICDMPFQPRASTGCDSLRCNEQNRRI